jgi:outer membrane protein OmpA-like peptidoglycan-associated protein
VLFPGHYSPAVPILDAPAPAPTLVPPDDQEPIDWSEVVEAPVFPFEQYTQELAGAVQTIESTTEVQITLGGDVLFATDSADLTPEAQAALQAAVAHLEGREGGTIDVVGHTDDVNTNEYNQDLSERRAQSVVAALETMIDTSKFDLVASGKGETEPVAPNDSDANRQLNRRVVITLIAEETTESLVGATGELPPFDRGLVATGADGVEVEELGRPFRVSAPEATRVGDALVVTIQVTALDNDNDPSTGFPGLSGVWGPRGFGNTSYPMNSLLVYVVAGATAVYPYEYSLGTTDSGTEVRRSLADLDASVAPAGGQTATLVGIYPALASTDHIAIQLDNGIGSAPPFRLTDIPIIDLG